MTERIKDKVVVITGASSGLGEAAARRLAQNGAKLVLGARRLDRLQTLAEELKLGADAVVRTDVALRAEVKRLVDRAVQSHGRIDVIVNNAGLMPLSPLERLKITMPATGPSATSPATRGLRRGNGQVRQWARRGTRPRQPADQRYDNAYLFGAICPARGAGAALALPYADADMMQLHLDEISRNVADGAHAVLLLDRAGWHTTGKLDVPDNITPIFLPSRAPELNPVENIWQYLRQNWLSNTVFENYDAIIDAACAAWRKLIAQPETITSIGMRDWAHVGQPL